MNHKIKIQKSVEADTAEILRLQYAAYQGCSFFVRILTGNVITV